MCDNTYEVWTFLVFIKNTACEHENVQLWKKILSWVLPRDLYWEIDKRKIFMWRHGGHVGVENNREKSLGTDSIIMQNLSDVLPLFCTLTWPSHHVNQNHELFMYKNCPSVFPISLFFYIQWRRYLFILFFSSTVRENNPSVRNKHESSCGRIFGMSEVDNPEVSISLIRPWPVLKKKKRSQRNGHKTLLFSCENLKG